MSVPDEPLEKPSFVVDSLIPTGLSLFCGSQKIGKSWLMLKLCLCVLQGLPLWDMPALEGDVLYFFLEDTFCHIQDRLFRLTDEASGQLRFAVKCIGGGHDSHDRYDGSFGITARKRTANWII